MNIDQKASLKARKEIIIESPVEIVWQTLTDINRWPDWQPDVTSAQLGGGLQAGSIFNWNAKGMNISSTLREVIDHQRVGWTGNSPGMQAVHTWTLQPRSSATTVITEESLSGWLARVIKFFDPKFLEKSLVVSLNVLKAQVEHGKE